MKSLCVRTLRNLIFHDGASNPYINTFGDLLSQNWNIKKPVSTTRLALDVVSSKRVPFTIAYGGEWYCKTGQDVCTYSLGLSLALSSRTWSNHAKPKTWTSSTMNLQIFTSKQKLNDTKYVFVPVILQDLCFRTPKTQEMGRKKAINSTRRTTHKERRGRRRTHQQGPSRKSVPTVVLG